MLQQLGIKNFALIDQVNLKFEKGYTTITGETGSGKSILLGALNLILGQRADYSVIRNPEEKTIVEAVFSISDKFKPFFEENELDFDSETLIRREIASGGKSRAFINDTPVSLNILSELTENLIYIHSQHETLAIKKANFQFELIDSFAGLESKSSNISEIAKNILSKKKLLVHLQTNSKERDKELDFLTFQLEELSAMDFAKNDFEKLEIELSKVSKLEDIRSLYHFVNKGISDENGVLDTIRSLRVQVDKWKENDEQLTEFSQRLIATFTELEDISNEAESTLENLEVDPERILFLETNVDNFNRLLRKHNVQSQKELVDLMSLMSQKLEGLEASDERLALLEHEISLLEKDYFTLAKSLFEERVKAGTQLSNHLLQLLLELKLSQAKLAFDIQQASELDKIEINAQGGMNISLLFSANAGMEMKSIEKAASGGELSRLMLAIQATMSEKKALPTLILDEIDTGVSGEVALRIGNLLHKMGNNLQLFAITHLPQVAAKAQHHLEVVKKSMDGTTQTTIQKLNSEDRVEAIAKLMSGENVTESAKQNAQHLMQINE